MTDAGGARGRAPVEHVFFDIGGVLGTNGWDREQRQHAADVFHLDYEEFGYRHHEVVGDWEEGRMTLDEYLDIAVFYAPRTFDRETFKAFMFDQSVPNPDAIALARGLSRHTGGRLYTLNNEADELNRSRIDRFGLRGTFTAFLSSCWLGLRKPQREFFERALSIVQADPATSLFVDDREQNLEPARRLGMQTVLFESAAQLGVELRRRGLGQG